jgi:hypothetical protein
MKPFENALPGFNHNVKHKGQLYHIQTEDSGKHNPTVTTLLFLGGNVLASLKASYAEHLDSEGLPRRIRELMEAQHKQMLRNLLKGQYDKEKEAHSKHWKVGQLDEHDIDATQQLPSLPVQTPPDTASPAEPSSPPEAQSPQAPQPLPSFPAPRSRPSRPLSVVPEVQAPQALSFEGEEAGAVFGEEVVSEKRFDELILNYLFREKDKLD